MVFGCQERSLFQQHTLAKMLTLGIFSNSQLSPSAAQIRINNVHEELQHDSGWTKMFYEKHFCKC